MCWARKFPEPTLDWWLIMRAVHLSWNAICVRSAKRKPLLKHRHTHITCAVCMYGSFHTRQSHLQLLKLIYSLVIALNFELLLRSLTVFSITNETANKFVPKTNCHIILLYLSHKWTNPFWRARTLTTDIVLPFRQSLFFCSLARTRLPFLCVRCCVSLAFLRKISSDLRHLDCLHFGFLFSHRMILHRAFLGAHQTCNKKCSTRFTVITAACCSAL